MKNRQLIRNIFSLAALTFALLPGAFSQIQFEHSFNYSTSVTTLENEGKKIFLMDVDGEQCRLYNSDYSLWKTVNINIPNNRWLADIKYVSQHVFNSDDLLEMLIIYYQYVEVGSSYYYIYTAEVINENGSVLLSVPGGAYVDMIPTSDQGSKLFVYVYDYSGFPFSVETKIYGVPGVPLGIIENPDDLDTKGKLFSAYPNPTNGDIKIRMNNGVFTPDAWLIIRDEAGIVRSRTMLQQGSAEQCLKLVDLPSGIYIYEVVTPYYRSKPAQFVRL